MRFPLLQPRWIGLHLVALLAVAACAGLGYWQFVRAQEPDREMITNPVEDLAGAAPIGSVLEPGAYMSETEANQAVSATGVYDRDDPLLAPALSPEGDEGYYVLVPLVTEDDTALTVNRGWIPESDADADAVGGLPALPEGEVEVTGWLISPQKEQDGYAPLSVPEGQVARIAPSLLVNEWPYRLYEGYLTLAEQRPASTGGDVAAPREIPPPDPPQGIVWNWRNVSYAAQWWVFGVAVLVFWISLMRREQADAGAGAGTDGGAGTPGPGGDGPSGGPGDPAGPGGSAPPVAEPAAPGR
ncbi:SURF1 family protein [Nocardiopsis sediminis]|uniref:SURF1-like protein n=1 Tax=Nocardiopsis sediminis TaxID=1778267 RepID=A0ABV8FSB7_9ACTN